MDALWKLGVEQGLSIFFFLFLVLCGVFGHVVNRFWYFIKGIMAENEAREQRYLNTIDNTTVKLGEIVKEVSYNVNELRDDVNEIKLMIKKEG